MRTKTAKKTEIEMTYGVGRVEVKNENKLKRSTNSTSPYRSGVGQYGDHCRDQTLAQAL
jgi:hypothetical protein